MNRWIIILCLMSAIAGAGVLQDIADKWMTPYSETGELWGLEKFGEAALRFGFVDPIWTHTGGGWITCRPQDKLSVRRNEESAYISVDGIEVLLWLEINTKTRIEYDFYPLPVLPEGRIREPVDPNSFASPPPKDPNEVWRHIEIEILSDPNRFGPWDKWKGFFE